METVVRIRNGAIIGSVDRGILERAVQELEVLSQKDDVGALVEPIAKVIETLLERSFALPYRPYRGEKMVTVSMPRAGPKKLSIVYMYQSEDRHGNIDASVAVKLSLTKRGIANVEIVYDGKNGKLRMSTWNEVAAARVAKTLLTVLRYVLEQPKP